MTSYSESGTSPGAPGRGQGAGRVGDEEGPQSCTTSRTTSTAGAWPRGRLRAHLAGDDPVLAPHHTVDADQELFEGLRRNCVHLRL